MAGGVRGGELRQEPGFPQGPSIRGIAQASPLTAVTRGSGADSPTQRLSFQLPPASRGSLQTSVRLIVVKDTSVL